LSSFSRISAAVIFRSVAKHTLCDGKAVLVKAAKLLTARMHHVGVGDNLSDKGTAFMVKDDGLLLRRDLCTRVGQGIRCGIGVVPLTVAYCLDITTEELHLDLASDVFYGAVDLRIESQFVWSEVTMTRTDLEIWLVEEALGAVSECWHASLGCSLHATLIYVCLPDDFIEAGLGDIKGEVAGVMVMVVLRGRLVSKSVLDDREHLAHCEEYALSILILVVNLKPFAQIIALLRLQDSSNFQRRELLLL